MIIVTGVAGAGKTTQCRRLSETGEFQWLSVSQLLRDTHNQAIENTMDHGAVVEDAVTLPIVEAELVERNDTPELLLDGFPRTTEQAAWLLEKHSAGFPFRISMVMHIKLSEDEALGRLHKRGRDDDNDEAIEKRFNLYDHVVLPIISHFKEAGIPVNDIDGTKSEDEVYEAIREVLKAR